MGRGARGRERISDGARQGRWAAAARRAHAHGGAWQWRRGTTIWAGGVGGQELEPVAVAELMHRLFSKFDAAVIEAGLFKVSFHPRSSARGPFPPFPPLAAPVPAFSSPPLPAPAPSGSSPPFPPLSPTSSPSPSLSLPFRPSPSPSLSLPRRRTSVSATRTLARHADSVQTLRILVAAHLWLASALLHNFYALTTPLSGQIATIAERYAHQDLCSKAAIPGLVRRL